MAEQLDITPVLPAAKSAVVQSILLDWGGQTITVVLLLSDTSSPVLVWSGSQASALMSSLNTANFSVKSLHRRILEKAVLDGKLPTGSVSGTPA